MMRMDLLYFTAHRNQICHIHSYTQPHTGTFLLLALLPHWIGKRPERGKKSTVWKRNVFNRKIVCSTSRTLCTCMGFVKLSAGCRVRCDCMCARVFERMAYLANSRAETLSHSTRMLIQIYSSALEKWLEKLEIKSIKHARHGLAHTEYLMPM